jgi:hypothetical protein
VIKCISVPRDRSHRQEIVIHDREFGDRECQIIALDRVQIKADKFDHHSGNSDWESLAHRRKIACMCALYKAYTGKRTW